MLGLDSVQRTWLQSTILVISFLLLAGENISTSASADSISPLQRVDRTGQGFVDARTRFKTIFCTVLEHHGRQLPDYRSCDKALVSVGTEPPPQSEASYRKVDLNPTNQDYIIGLVPGVAWQCVRRWLSNDNSGPLHAKTHGYDIRLFEVHGLSGTRHNASQIRDHVLALPDEDRHRPIILIAYSKGVADSLYAIAAYPELHEQVVAVVSVAGAVGGSPLADDATQSELNLLASIPFSSCEKGDDKAIESLHTETRRQWLARNPLPRSIAYYSVIAYPERKNISLGLKPSYNKLARIDPGNDGQLIFYDQLIPGLSLLAFVNADHWALSVPVARQIFLNRISFANKSEFPREVLLEAILRYVEEDLSRNPG